MTASIERVLVTPRWAGSIDSDWYPWIAAREARVERVPLPQPEAPTIAGCVEAFGAALRSGDPARTLCVGHSVSCLGWLHTLAAHEVRVAGLLCVAGWWTIDDPWPTIQPWIDAKLPVTALRGLIVVVTLPCLWFLSQAIAGSFALIDIGRIQSSPVLRLPMWIPYLSLPVGLGYFGLEFILAMVARWKDPAAGRSAS